MSLTTSSDGTVRAASNVYFWSLRPETDHNAAFRGEGTLRNKSSLIAKLNQQNMEYQSGAGFRSFYEYLKQKKRTPNPHLDVLVIEAHGLPICSGGLYVNGKEIHIHTKELDPSEKADFIKLFRECLAERSAIVLDSCLSGNKCLSNNFASVLSEHIPQAKVFASQEESYGQPILILNGENRVERVAYEVFNKKLNGYIMVNGVQYEQGKETTESEPKPIPLMQRMAFWLASSRLFPHKFASSFVRDLM